MSINKRISDIIEYTKLTQKEFADAIDANPSKISHILTGRNGPSLEIISQIKSKFTELSWDWIIFGTGDMLQPIAEKKTANTEIKEQKKNAPPLPPNLFTMINDNFSEEIKNEKDFDISNENFISHSQTLGNVEKNNTITIKKIVIFYDNGKFESYDPS